jgi:hypothetical protein
VTRGRWALLVVVLAIAGALAWWWFGQSTALPYEPINSQP